jgi:hypothetical protein
LKEDAWDFKPYSKNTRELLKKKSKAIKECNGDARIDVKKCQALEATSLHEIF